ncbi:hypothetical protein Clacol_000699 [Clathrus columnatus]|uniref:Elongation factor 3 n=1 Tax=Clathrus columnatus TaxID=1419009 RepID=A0AAV4ZZD4_9AGAM|nr:hypothetical protein Clacol_000699 [Clathrus columnatus]
MDNGDLDKKSASPSYRAQIFAYEIDAGLADHILRYCPPVSMSSVDTLVSLMDELKLAPTAPDAKAAATKLAKEVHKKGLFCLSDNNVIETLHSFSTNKKSGYERESGALGLQYLAQILGPSSAVYLLPSLPILYDLYMDKGDVVRDAAAEAIKAILNLFPPESVPQVFRVLEEIIEKGKWKAKVGALDGMKMFVKVAREQVANELGTTLLKVELALHDTKQEVSTAATKCATQLCTTLDNPDITPHIPLLVKCMSNPNQVPECIKALSSTTFVAEVKAPTLAVLVPMLLRALNDRSMEVQRRTVVVIDNLVKLVRDPKVAARYLSSLVEGVHRIMESASFPEVRAFAAAAHATLLKAGALSSGIPPPPRDLEKESADAYTQTWTIISPDLIASSSEAVHPLLEKTLRFSSSMIANLVYDHAFTVADNPTWIRTLGIYLDPWLPKDSTVTGAGLAERVREHFLASFMAQFKTTTTTIDGEELLCDTLFSLAYGALLLLSHTTLRLVKGRRYGILGPNGSGKSTLLRSLKEGKVENFPPQDVVRTTMVEHALMGEDTSLNIVDFIGADKQLAGIARSKIVEKLKGVGFNEERLAGTVGSLSGGWKMKLELARSMLYNADLLLLDEPTNHLDHDSVKWLEDYLISQKNVTCLIVSHDSRFLDNVTTDIIHYEAKKLVYYPGNLSLFVEKHPEAKSYYTLAATSIKFSFPPPGSLMGVRSNTRAILKMVKCTYKYPKRTEPALIDVSCALSLSSRVGIIGPNGAGKSTLIKLLTGESEPQEGTVYKHPALRVAYVSQHATHHIDRHLEKTPMQYIQWRYQDGHDREILEKATRVLTEEEQKVMDTIWVGRTGEKRQLEMIMGRQKLKKSFQYEVKWRGLDHKFNVWIPREQLIEKGFTKLMQQFDDLEASREGAGFRETTSALVRKHLEDIGLDGDIAQYNEISGLSGGQKIKLVIAAALWNNPQICVLDEPTNFLDREALGGLAVAIRDWAGAVVIISHNDEFVTALCPEIWKMENGRLTHKGTSTVVEDAFADGKLIKSRGVTPAASAVPTPVASGAEDGKNGTLALPVIRKKKKTRNQLKAQEERRRLRKLDWLARGGPKPEDTDSD